MALKNEKPYRPNPTLLMTGTLLFAVYYLADCFLDSCIFNEGSLLENLVAPSGHEIAMRSLSGAFLFALYMVATTMLNKNRLLQQDLLEKSHEILESNRELDTYHHTLSYALRNTLTEIMLTKERLKFECYQYDSERGKDLLNQLGSNCAQLSGKIDEMLSYAEANRSKLERKRVAIDDIAREIAKRLSGEEKGYLLDFQIDNNLSTECDPELMHVALKNLIDNSVRKNSSYRHKEIHIGMKKREGVPIYYIRNVGSPSGPNQDASHRPKQEQVVPPQNCIGFRTARAIIERHGGQLWAKPAGDGNQTFYFTL